MRWTITKPGKVGADIPKRIAALEHSSAASWALARRGLRTGKWAEKDMDVALDQAQNAGVAMPLAGLVDQLVNGMNQE